MTGLKSVRPTAEEVMFLQWVIFVAGLVFGTLTKVGAVKNADNLGDWSLMIGGLSLGAIFLVVAPYRVWKRDVDRFQTDLNDLAPLKSLRDIQREDARPYLQVVAEELDLDLGVNDSPDTLQLKLCVDSMLVEDFAPAAAEVVIRLAGVNYKKQILPAPVIRHCQRTDNWLPGRTQFSGHDFKIAVKNARETRHAGCSVKLNLYTAGKEKPLVLEQQCVPVRFPVGVTNATA